MNERICVNSHNQSYFGEHKSAASRTLLPLPRGFGVGLQTCENWVFSPKQPPRSRQRSAASPALPPAFQHPVFTGVILISLFPIIFSLPPMPTQTVIPGRRGGNLLPGCTSISEDELDSPLVVPSSSPLPALLPGPQTHTTANHPLHIESF